MVFKFEELVKATLDEFLIGQNNLISLNHQIKSLINNTCYTVFSNEAVTDMLMTTLLEGINRKIAKI